MYRIFFKLCEKLHLILLIKIGNIKNIIVPFLKYKYLKRKLKVFLAGHTVVIVTGCVAKMITSSTMVRQFFDNMNEASTDKEWL